MYFLVFPFWNHLYNFSIYSYIFAEYRILRNMFSLHLVIFLLFYGFYITMNIQPSVIFLLLQRHVTFYSCCWNFLFIFGFSLLFYDAPRCRFLCIHPAWSTQTLLPLWLVLVFGFRKFSANISSNVSLFYFLSFWIPVRNKLEVFTLLHTLLMIFSQSWPFLCVLQSEYLLLLISPPIPVSLQHSIKWMTSNENLRYSELNFSARLLPGILAIPCL